MSWKGAVCNPTSTCRCRSMRFGVEATISLKLPSRKCRRCNADLIWIFASSASCDRRLAFQNATFISMTHPGIVGELLV